MFDTSEFVVEIAMRGHFNDFMLKMLPPTNCHKITVGEDAGARTNAAAAAPSRRLQ